MEIFWGRGALLGQVQITLGEWILIVTHPNGECCENVVSNTGIGKQVSVNFQHCKWKPTGSIKLGCLCLFWIILVRHYFSTSAAKSEYF